MERGFGPGFDPRRLHHTLNTEPSLSRAFAPTLTQSSGDVLAVHRKACGRVPRRRLAKLRSVLALLLSLICLGSLKRGRRSDCGVVARETRPPIHRHENGSLRSRTWPFQPLGVVHVDRGDQLSDAEIYLGGSTGNSIG